MLLQGLERPEEPGLNALRTVRDLKEGMVSYSHSFWFFLTSRKSP